MSAPVRQQVRDDAKVSTGSRDLKEAPKAVQTGKGSTEVPAVRTLHGPPEIWELVRPEPPQHFSPGLAFVTRITSSTTNLVLVTIGVILISGGGTFAILRLLKSPKVSGISAQVEEKRKTNQIAPFSQTSNSPANVGGSPVQSDLSNNYPGSEHGAIGRQANGVRLNNDPATTASFATSDTSRSPRRLGRGESRRDLNDTVPGDNETIPNSGIKSQSGTAHIAESDPKPAAESASTKPKSNTPLSPKLIAPPTSGSAPKAKVIQWP